LAKGRKRILGEGREKAHPQMRCNKKERERELQGQGEKGKEIQ
jgi:hypothetical protein